MSSNLESMVITGSELNSAENLAQAKLMKESEEQSKRASVGAQTKPSKLSSGAAATFYLSASGLVGGIVAFLLNQIYDSTLGANTSDFNQSLFSSIFLALGIGLTVTVAEALTTRSGEKIRLAFEIAIPISIYFGTVLGSISELIFLNLRSGLVRQENFLASSGTSTDAAAAWLANHSHFARALCWAILGIAAGLTVGVASRSLKRTLLSIGGGVLGGFLGGLLTDFFPNNLQWVSLIFGFAFMGLLVGLSMGLLEQVAKMQWIEIVKGGREGKQYILYKPEVTLGSSASAEITLTRDEGILPIHARIFTRYSRMYFECIDESKPALVDGTETVFTMISNGAEIQIGETIVRFRERKAGAEVVAGIS